MKKLLVALLVLGLAAPAIAAEVGFYGSFRTHLGYYDVSEEYGTTAAFGNTGFAGPDMDQTIAATGEEGGFDDAGTVLSLSGQSRFGAKAKVTDTLSAIFEAGLKDSSRWANSTYASGSLNGGETDQVYLRLAYGVWNFGAGNFTFGKNYTPLTFLLYSNQIADLGDQGEAIFLVGGIPYAGRQPQLRLTFGGFDVALIEPNTDVNESVSALSASPYTSDVDYTFPKLEMAYTFNSPMLSLRPAFGIQTYEAVVRGADEEEEDILSWIGALGVQLRFNPIYINMMGSYNVNPYNYGIKNMGLGAVGGILMSAQLDADGDVEDSTLITGIISVGAKLSPMLKVEAGFSYSMVEVDNAALVGAADATSEQTGMIFYVQAPITVAPGVTVTPEIGMVDRGDIETDDAEDLDQGEMTYGVVSFRIDF